MKYIVLTCFIFLLLPNTKAQKVKHEQTIQALFNDMNKHDSVAIASYFADSARLESPNWEGQEKGKQGVTTVYSRYFKGTPDLQFSISNIVSSNNTVVVEYTFGGKFSNPEAGTPEYMRNKTYMLKASTRYNFKNNKIIFATTYFDQVAFLRQVGFFDQH